MTYILDIAPARSNVAYADIGVFLALLRFAFDRSWRASHSADESAHVVY